MVGPAISPGSMGWPSKAVTMPTMSALSSHTNLRCGCTPQRYRRAARNAFFDWVNIGVPHIRDPGGSPFQMPARLADGLGHGSDLIHGYPWPFAPSPNLRPGSLGPPHWPSGRKANLGCINCCLINRTPGQFVKRLRGLKPLRTVASHYALAQPSS
jgi:hypothetical protein